MRAAMIMAIATLVSSAAPCAAQWCSGADAPWISARARPDGTVLTLYGCTYLVSQGCSQDIEPVFRVTDSDGNSLGGTVVKWGMTADHGNWAAWKPDQPLLMGGSYKLTNVDPSSDAGVDANGLSAMFEVGQPDIDLTALHATFQVSQTVVGAGEQTCCEPGPSFHSCDAYQPCLFSQRKEVMQVALTTDAPMRDFEWLYRITLSADLTSKLLPDQAAPNVQTYLTTPADKYCYSLDAVDPISETVQHVSDGCQTLGITALTTRAASDQELKDDLSQCKTPPAGYESDWTRLGFGTLADAGVRDAAVPFRGPDSGVMRDAAPQNIDDVISNETSSNSGCAIGSDARGAGWMLALLLLLLNRFRRVRIAAHSKVLLNLGVCGAPPAGYESDWTRLGFMSSASPVPLDAGMGVPQDASVTAPDAATLAADSGVSASQGVAVQKDTSGCALASASIGGAGWLLALSLFIRRRKI